MKITSKFTLATHIICAIEYFKEVKEVTSSFLSKSTGANPVVVRTIIGELKEKNIVSISQGKTGITLLKALEDITFYDVYSAVKVSEDGFFRFHDNPNPDCPVGKNIHAALDKKLEEAERAFEENLKKMRVSEVYEIIKKENLK